MKLWYTVPWMIRIWRIISQLDFFWLWLGVTVRWEKLFGFSDKGGKRGRVTFKSSCEHANVLKWNTSMQNQHQIHHYWIKFRMFKATLDSFDSSRTWYFCVVFNKHSVHFPWLSYLCQSSVMLACHRQWEQCNIENNIIQQNMSARITILPSLCLLWGTARLLWICIFQMEKKIKILQCQYISA